MPVSYITKIIRSRRSVYPRSYLRNAPIAKEDIEEILENATWAPTHKKTEPWRFVVFHSEESRIELSKFVRGIYKSVTPEEEYIEEKYLKLSNNALQSGCVIAIILCLDEAKRLPEWEEMAATACAVQNMWLTCTEKGIGAYWSTHFSINYTKYLLELAENERCVGFFFMGKHNLPEIPNHRTPFEKKTFWR